MGGGCGSPPTHPEVPFFTSRCPPTRTAHRDEHGLAYARSSAFYDTTLFWQWMRLPGDVVFVLGALLMAWDFAVKLRPLFPRFVARFIPSSRILSPAAGAE
jgi:nitric oxide reductase subunit B